ncbi:hypothetical protein SAY87_022995 [Trapa incisa]|uniref:UTP23 sensor motif region domain-containing protein n=1 Tax=Trapa incisa TaxID=236973 RepID=A0AAN7K506_9MYRT|nr:hypothetical protein SAY87_022995 [Trapa incisa]
MKHGKRKRHRRCVTFFSACYGFRSPFKVLCDGTFVYNLVVNRVVPADKAVSDTLSAPVKLFITRCVLEELRRLGRSHADTLAAASSLAIARCDHEGKSKADSCLLDLVKENNSEHFFVATQDADLRKKLQEIPGVPVMYGLRNALFLEQPSSAQREFVKDGERRRSHISDRERRQLLKSTGVNLPSTVPKWSSDDEKDVASHNEDAAVNKKSESTRKRLTVKDRPRFKRKKAKGPNPLSCLKKKTSENKKPASE